MSANSEQSEPNLVPILDMVFQLITFFMLVINFKAGTVDQELALPVIGSTRPIDSEVDSRIVVVNIRESGAVVVRGEEKPQFPLFARLEAQTIRASNGLGPNDPLPMRIVIRADRTITVATLMQVVNACRGEGFDKFDFVVTQTNQG